MTIKRIANNNRKDYAMIEQKMTNKQQIEEMRYWNEVLSPLVGAKIIGYQALPYREDVYPRIIVKTTSGKKFIIEAWRDEECNGAGVYEVFEEVKNEHA